MNLNLTDLNTLLAAIDIAVKRGTYSVLEVGAVSTVAEKLNTFLISAREQAEQNKAAEGEAASAEGQAEAAAAPEAEAAPAAEQA
jgi:hypothetical protein